MPKTIEAAERVETAKKVCIVDDAFLTPAEMAKCELNKVFYNCKLNEFTEYTTESWSDPIKSLCSSLIEDDWIIQAFSHPENYIEKLEKDVFLSNVIIFDWEYTGKDVDHVKTLEEVLSISPVHICIYSGVDKQDEIQSIIDINLARYKSRLDFLNKYEDASKSSDTVQQLKDKLENLRNNSFPIAFGTNLRNIGSRSIESTLVNFANLDLEKVLELLSHNNESEEVSKDIKELLASKISEQIQSSTEIKEILTNSGLDNKTVDEVVGLIDGKIQGSIVSSTFTLPQNPGSSSEENNDIMRRLWSYRLYHNHSETDQIVRTGDIIVSDDASAAADFSCLYLVITDNCSLHRFTNKTGESLNVIELAEISQYPSIVKPNESNFTSLTNVTGLSKTDGKPLLLPYVPIDETELKDYLLFMQKHKVIKPTGTTKGSPLLYEHIPYSRVCSISSLFLHPLIGTIITNLFGWGCSDYPKRVQKDIITRCKLATQNTKGNE